MVTFHICSYSSSSFEVTAQHQGFLGSNSIVNHAVVVGVQVITAVVQVIPTVVTAVVRNCSEPFHPSPHSDSLSSLPTPTPKKIKNKKIEPNYFQLCGFVYCVV